MSGVRGIAPFLCVVSAIIVSKFREVVHMLSISTSPPPFFTSTQLIMTLHGSYRASFFQQKYITLHDVSFDACVTLTFQVQMAKITYLKYALGFDSY